MGKAIGDVWTDIDKLNPVSARTIGLPEVVFDNSITSVWSRTGAACLSLHGLQLQPRPGGRLARGIRQTS